MVSLEPSIRERQSHSISSSSPRNMTENVLSAPFIHFSLSLLSFLTFSFSFSFSFGFLFLFLFLFFFFFFFFLCSISCSSALRCRLAFSSRTHRLHRLWAETAPLTGPSRLDRVLISSSQQWQPSSRLLCEDQKIPRGPNVLLYCLSGSLLQ